MPRLEVRSVPSVGRALSVLELLGQFHHGLTLSQVSQRLALPKSSTYMIMTTLERRGYLQKDNRNGRFRFGLKLVSLSWGALESLELAEEAKPFLQSLMQKTGLTVHMAVLEGNEAVIIDKIDAPGPNRITTTWVGRRVGAHCTGIGKAMIAFLPEEEFRRQIGGKALWKYNQNTITSVGKLKHALASIRSQGYAVSNEEAQIGYRGIGAPIFDGTGQMVAGISVDGTIDRISPDLVPALAQQVRQTAAAISSYLSHGKAPSP